MKKNQQKLSIIYIAISPLIPLFVAQVISIPTMIVTFIFFADSSKCDGSPYCMLGETTPAWPTLTVTLTFLTILLGYYFLVKPTPKHMIIPSLGIGIYLATCFAVFTVLFPILFAHYS